MRRGVRFRVVGTCVALLAAVSACGSRAADEEKLRARGLGDGAAVGSSAGRLAGPADAGGSAADATSGGGGPGTDAATAGAAGAPGEPGTTGTDGEQPGASAGVGAPAPPRGNGGATDVGVTADTIRLGNVSTLSGPIPGLFQGAVIGAQAFVAYANSQGGVFGRRLALEVRDDQFDAGQNGAQTQDLAKRVVAFLGSFSTFDDAGADAVRKEGVADVGYGLTDARRTMKQNFSPQPGRSGTFRTGGFRYYAKKFPDAVKSAGTIYGDIPASKGSALDAMAAAEAAGWNWVYERAYQPTEADFTADVVRMRQSGVKAVYVVAADVKTMARLLNAMHQQSFRPQLIAFGASAYDGALLTLAKDAAEGVYIDQQLALYQGGDAATIPEVALMNEWVAKIKPGYKPDLFAAFSWASGRLLLQALQAAGPDVTRQGLLTALGGIDQFDANGLVAPAGPASKRQPVCDLFMQVKAGRFVRVDPPGKGYICDGAVHQR
jgi:ABC-type branched-subunit amino acid transport system substrate-binding protein